jgi:dipeptidyl aminopeptidase/acylaminoacyl peptidase
MGVQQIAWSPDGKKIAYATADDLPVKQGFERHNDSFEVFLNDDYLTHEEKTSTHIWVVSSVGSAPQRMTFGTWSLPISHPPGPPASAITWTPDGAGIVFATQPTPHGNGAGAAASTGGGPAVQVVNVADGLVKPLPNVIGTFPVYSPSGTDVAFMGSEAVSLSINGGPARKMGQSIDRGLARVLWMPDGKSLLVGANDTARVSLWTQPIDGSAARKLDLGDLSPNSSFFVDVNVGKTGGIAFVATTTTHASELYYMASPTSAPVALTNVNAETAMIPLGKTELIEWTNDNFHENGTLTYPPDFNPSQKYPLVLLIHGGPRAASMMTYSAAAQLMAAKGWLVFQPNYRGSDNLGGAYRSAISGDAGAGPGRDVIAGMDEIKKRGFVDESRQAVSGWSYGGYMTTWMLGHYDIWKAAVAGAAVTDEIDQQTLGDGAGGRGGQNSVWANPQAMDRQREQSPITYASKMKAPTLILCDVGDYRVPIVESYKLFHALRDNGVTAQFFAYPVVGHSPSDPVRQRDVQRRWIGWLEQYLNGAPATSGGR